MSRMHGKYSAVCATNHINMFKSHWKCVFSVWKKHSEQFSVSSFHSGNTVYREATANHSISGRGMGPLLVLVSPCFRENVVVTCKIGSSLCSLDNLYTSEKGNVFFFGNQISKWRSFEKKKAILTYFSHFLVTREKLQKFLRHLSLTYIHIFCSRYWLFFTSLILEKKNANLSGMVSLWCDSLCWFLSAPFWNNQYITKWWAKFVGMSTTDMYLH